MSNQNEAANKILSVTDHQTIDSLWEISSHGTKRTDVELAYLSGYQAALAAQAKQIEELEFQLRLVPTQIKNMGKS